MRRVFLNRDEQNKFGTFGRLYDEDGTHLCYTLENVWLNNTPNWSCIPPGDYIAVRNESDLRGGEYLLTGVTGRFGITFHVGNRDTDTEGCILLGLHQAEDGEGPNSIYGSAEAMEEFMKEHIEDMILVTIINPEHEGWI